ncbi:MAG: hypothetical protein WD555_02635 [Fulvivirga sp.]
MDHPSFWIQANSFGTVAVDRQMDLSSHLAIGNNHHFSLVNSKRNTSSESSQTDFYVGYGLDVYVNNGFGALFAKEAFARVGYQQWELRVGRYAERIGEVDPELSSGSFAVSGNALGR